LNFSARISITRHAAPENEFAVSATINVSDLDVAEQEKINLIGLPLEELDRLLSELDQPPY
jgi:hypothetical protein